MDKHTNSLINESSPYLLQHAHNPVNWEPWSNKIFEQAADSGKLVIISIGYSSCHWCHVMEHESFEDSLVAHIMNENFISVKVDREERPDVDQIYMTALQLMTGRGGWPLNVVTLPDGRPVWGATYVPKENWMQALQQLTRLYHDDPSKMEEYAEKLTEGIKQTEIVELNTADPDFKTDDADTIFNNWKVNFDSSEGGPNRAPKFPMPNSYEFLLSYGQLAKSEEAIGHVQLSLNKMAMGGIYDQLSGGFARYSTDAFWIAPHFEKMLYDNAQLMSLYSKAYQKFKSPLYKRVVEQTVNWLTTEMTGPHGEFYSALDADSEGEEGKFYVWLNEELETLIPDEDWDEFSEYYDLKKGQWEGKIILIKHDVAENPQAEKWNQILLKYRSKRERPGLDDKSLTSWNALMITGLVDAYKAFGDEDYLKLAVANAEWLSENQIRTDGSLWHSFKANKSSIDGLIEDYAFAIQAFLSLFEATADENYLQQAVKWVNFVQENFEDKTTGLFYMRNIHGEQLIAKSLETVDNVIPASNSVMAHNLYHLGFLLNNKSYRDQALNMLNQVNKDRILEYGESYSNWAQLLLNVTFPHFEIAISGQEAEKNYLSLNETYLPNTIIIWKDKKSELPLLQNRFIANDTYIYVCEDMVCNLPVTNYQEAIKQLKPVL